ncbi:hypothetical protein [Phocicoccus pinnipedialis]|uniref:Uncharacterized protein n=1 Tax=Phocicoccus pinnipedialis TaxID=110845 RepID=A0A6V7RND2_9BACL|nr:hypothetical protein [Jeotgalicoccus pinnipedialis]MBP1940266.1 hypothetical protein [Jeotgalicoccus pinnipedialis]CAD2079707.1 hypothetical protein JEOPIN946_01604 [Jeotgalicoccus pinnipedialis]
MKLKISKIVSLTLIILLVSQNLTNVTSANAFSTDKEIDFRKSVPPISHNFSSEFDYELYQNLLDELGLEKDIPFNEEIPPEIIKKLQNSPTVKKIEEKYQTELSENSFTENNSNLVTTQSIKVIRLGKYIREQGYMGNRELRSYVSYVNRNSYYMGWIALVTGFTSGVYGAIPIGILTQFATGSQFETVKSKAYSGYGMGWVNMYASGKNSYSIIPRRDFSKNFILYKK